MSFIRGRRRASLSLLVAGCLGFALLTAAPTTTSATTPAAMPATGGGAQADYTPADCHNAGVKKDVARCFAMVYTGGPGRRAAARAEGPLPTSLGPADIRDAYNLPDGGEGQTIAVVDAYGNSHAEEDLAVFRAHYGLPPCTTANGCFRKTDQRGGTNYPADESGWAMETSLDLDAISSACPACSILLVEGDSAGLEDLGTAVDTAVRLGAKFVSNSYSLPGELPSETAYDHHFDHPGVVITASTGDTGNVQGWPATNPHVTAVGGTRLTQDAGTDRGWTETPWSGGGSGCSLYEPQPDFQAGLGTGCDSRAVADISAVADPATGLAVYDTLSGNGWLQVGGTSLSAPLIAGMYALAGTPAPDTYPVSYPYIGQRGLFDITQGSNGSCGTVLCNAQEGWDGPTGLGTPNGIAALTLGERGTVSGKVTDQGTGKGLAQAELTLVDKLHSRTFHATTGSDGSYHLPVSTGTYEATATTFGYAAAQSQTGVEVGKDETVTVNLALKKEATRTVSGKVTDGSEHGWPLYTKITIDGYPHGAVYTNPVTGVYSVELPAGRTYSLHLAPVYPGYQSSDLKVALGSRDERRDLKATHERTSCRAPGYGYAEQQDFEGWTGGQPQSGWKVIDNSTSGHAWRFDEKQVNVTGGSGNYASVDPLDHDGAAMDTSLLTPVIDLPAGQPLVVAFNNTYLPDVEAGTAGSVDVSFDSGRTWTAKWRGAGESFMEHIQFTLPEDARRSGVQIRLHYKGSGESLWQIDDFTVGACAEVAGGLVLGNVTDGNTGAPVVGATVSDLSGSATAVPAVSAATPDDAALADGFYWLFSSHAGKHSYAGAAARYTTATGKATVAADRVVRHDIALQAGRVVVSRKKVGLSADLGHTATQTLRFRNTGRAPVHVTLGEQNSGYTFPDGTSAASLPGTPLKMVRARSDFGPALKFSGKFPASRPPTSVPTPKAESASPWVTLPNYPEMIMDNAVGYYAGKVYSVGGSDKVQNGKATSHGYAYAPGTNSWKRIADLPKALDALTGSFVGNTMYVVGGWKGDGDFGEQSTVYAYHPASDNWTRGADLPVPVAIAKSAVLDGQLYVIGGCRDRCRTSSAEVYRYNPAADTWTRLADYPTKLHSAACAGISGTVVCAGGSTFSSQTAATYRYDVRGNTWTRVADMPYATVDAAAGGADGKLQVVGGLWEAQATNRVLEYDPVTNGWTNLPNAPLPVFRGGGSCGLYQIGGPISADLGLPQGSTTAQALPGYDQCGGDDVAWLSENRSGFDLEPGRSITVKVRADASAVLRAGTYTARLTVVTDSPYTSKPVGIAFSVTPSHGGGGHPGKPSRVARGR